MSTLLLCPLLFWRSRAAVITHEYSKAEPGEGKVTEDFKRKCKFLESNFVVSGIKTKSKFIKPSVQLETNTTEVFPLPSPVCL